MKEDGNDVFSDLIDPSDDTIVFYGDARQIKATALENLVGKAYMNVLPMYISDIKDTMEAATVCGRVVGLEKREYRNKNFGLNLPTGGRFKRIRPMKNCRCTRSRSTTRPANFRSCILQGIQRSTRWICLCATKGTS